MKIETMLPAAADVTYFLEVAHTLNISRAAERLGLTQPSLSLALQRLERAIGVPLLVRGKTGVALSKAGQRFVPRARALLDEWERLRNEAKRDESETFGRYTMGCHASVAIISLPAVFPGLLEAYPGIEFKLVHDLSRRITEDVISYKVDFGLVVNPVAHADLVIKPLYRDEVQVWARDFTHPLADPKSGQAVLILDPDLQQTQYVQKKLAAKHFDFARTITTSSLEVAASLVAAGCGAGVLPSRVAKRFAEGGEIKPLGRDAPKFSDRVCLVYRADIIKTQAQRRLLRDLESALREV